MPKTRKEPGMDNREFANFIREKAAEFDIDPVQLEAAAGAVLTTTVINRIGDADSEEQLFTVLSVIASVMTCLNVTVKMLRDEEILKALEKICELFDDFAKKGRSVQ